MQEITPLAGINNTSGYIVKDCSVQIIYIDLPETDPYFRLKRQWESRKFRMDMSIPYKDKDAAKNLGAKWDSENKTWYTTDADKLHLFDKWIAF